VRERVAAYVDGFNLYNGLKAKHGKRYVWLDLPALATSLLLPSQELVAVRYFTARVHRPASTARQAVYLDALAARSPLLTITEGRFQAKSVQCYRCGGIRTAYEEKETDVNIAVALVQGALRDAYDAALLISADSDLCPVIRTIRQMAPAKRVVALFPPRRASKELRQIAHGAMTISDSKIRQSQLPQVVTGAGGVKLVRPREWG
jgi:uncharacterized LabA/DUF88 family protein